MAEVAGYIRFPNAGLPDPATVDKVVPTPLLPLRGDSKFRPYEGWYDVNGLSFVGGPPGAPPGSGPGTCLVRIATRRAPEFRTAADLGTLYGTAILVPQDAQGKVGLGIVMNGVHIGRKDVSEGVPKPSAPLYLYGAPRSRIDDRYVPPGVTLLDVEIAYAGAKYTADFTAEKEGKWAPPPAVSKE